MKIVKRVGLAAAGVAATGVIVFGAASLANAAPGDRRPARHPRAPATQVPGEAARRTPR